MGKEAWPEFLSGPGVPACGLMAAGSWGAGAHVPQTLDPLLAFGPGALSQARAMPTRVEVPPGIQGDSPLGTFPLPDPSPTVPSRHQQL